MHAVTEILTQRQTISRIRGEFDEWAAKYRLAVEKFASSQSQEACRRLLVLEEELGRIARQI